MTPIHEATFLDRTLTQVLAQGRGGIWSGDGVLLPALQAAD